MKTQERKHRLPKESYVGRIRCAFTICTQDRERLFVSTEIFQFMKDTLMEALAKAKCEAHVFLFMPDHCHMLIEGITEESDLWQCMVDFKQKSGYWLCKDDSSKKWQKDFYDHILRRDDDLNKQVRYILGNPLRKGLVEDWREYPYKGSTLYDFSQW